MAVEENDLLCVYPSIAVLVWFLYVDAAIKKQIKDDKTKNGVYFILNPGAYMIARYSQEIFAYSYITSFGDSEIRGLGFTYWTVYHQPTNFLLSQSQLFLSFKTCLQDLPRMLIAAVVVLDKFREL